MTTPKYKNHFCQSSKNEGSYTRFLRYLADVNQAENKKQHHDLFYMKWNLAPSLTLNKKRNSMKIQISCMVFFCSEFFIFHCIEFYVFRLCYPKIAFLGDLDDKVSCSCIESHWKANNNMTFVRAILNRLLQITPRTKIFSLFKTLSRFFTNNIFLYLHSKSSADFLFKQFWMANIHYDRMKEYM